MNKDQINAALEVEQAIAAALRNEAFKGDRSLVDDRIVAWNVTKARVVVLEQMLRDAEQQGLNEAVGKLRAMGAAKPYKP